MTKEHHPLTADIVGHKFVDKIELKGLSNPEFLPESALNLLVHEETVRATISTHLPTHLPKTKVDSLVKYSIRNKRVFLTCVMSKHVPCINELSLAGFSDDSLPVLKGSRKAGSPISSSHQVKSWDCFQGNSWDVEERRHFCEYQWMFSAFVFKGVDFSFRIDRRCPLPYVQLSDTSSSDDHGHSGLVYKVGLLKEHFNATPPRYLSSPNSNGAYEVAVKKLQIEGAKEHDIENYFNKEKKTLHIIRKLDHKHLIQAIAVYERGSGNPKRYLEKYFLFPWAARGNLRSFWSDNDPSENRPDLISWALKEMGGLADGLMRLHQEKTRHGDIKPENILLFSSDGDEQPTLVIADVGIAKFHSEETRKRKEEGYITTNAKLRYEPPEIELRPGENISRRFDVWSMGCVLLEFIIWLLHGSDGQRIFNKELREKEPRIQRFWHVDKQRQPCIHPVVQEWLNRLGQDAKGTPVLEELLELVEHRLLVGSVSEEPQANAKEQRAHSKEMRESISQMEKKCLIDPSYLWNPARMVLTGSREPATKAVASGESLALSQNVGL